METRSGVVYRIDRFRVPDQSMAEFMGILRETHKILAGQEGLVRDYMLEQTPADGTRTILTFAEWMTEQAYEDAVEVVKRYRRSSGIEPKDVIRRLGIEAEFGTYSYLPDR